MWWVKAIAERHHTRLSAIWAPEWRTNQCLVSPAPESAPGLEHDAGEGEAGRGSEVVESLPDKVSHATGRRTGGEGHVGVGEEQDFAGGRVCAALRRMGLAEPPRRQFVDVQHPEPRVLFAQAFGDFIAVRMQRGLVPRTA